MTCSGFYYHDLHGIKQQLHSGKCRVVYIYHIRPSVVASFQFNIKNKNISDTCNHQNGCKAYSPSALFHFYNSGWVIMSLYLL